MTAPNTNTEPTFDDLDPMERTIQSTLHESSELVGAEQPITDRPRDASGKFVSVAEGVAEVNTDPNAPGAWNVIPDADRPSDPLPTDPAAPTDPQAPAAPVIPDGHVALAPLAADKVQGFKVLDGEGEIVAPDLKFEVNFRGPNGENQPRTLDLPKLVNYARMGVYNHERETQALAVRSENTQLYATVNQKDQALSQLRAEREALLTNPDYLMEQLAKHEQENTPAAKQQREREAFETEKARMEYDRAAQHNGSYLDSQVAPALDTIAKSLPTVTMDELAGRLAMLVEPFKVWTQFGVILNPNATAAIERVIINELVPWAQSVHMSREDSAPAVPAKTPIAPAPKPSTPAPTDLQARAQKARRLAVSALKPVSGNPPQGAPSTPSAPRTNRDMEEFVVTRSLAASRSG